MDSLIEFCVKIVGLEELFIVVEIINGLWQWIEVFEMGDKEIVVVFFKLEMINFYLVFKVICLSLEWVGFEVDKIKLEM